MKLKCWILFIAIGGLLPVKAQVQDTIIDSDYTWETLKSKFDLHYSQTLFTQDFSNYQKQIDNMDLIDVTYYGYDNKLHRGQLICHQSVADDLKSIFNQLLWIKFPIYSVIPISEFNFDDYLSMRANNTTCFDFRKKTLKNGWSEHAFGRAIDLNPIQNPYITNRVILPETFDLVNPTGRIRLYETNGQQIISIFRMYGWLWGGHWHSSKDYMHFEGLH